MGLPKTRKDLDYSGNIRVVNALRHIASIERTIIVNRLMQEYGFTREKALAVCDLPVTTYNENKNMLAERGLL